MLSRRTTSILADIYNDKFYHSQISKAPYGRGTNTYHVDRSGLYDFLFEHDYEPWLCQKAERLNVGAYYSKPRVIKEFIMKLHTGETQYSATDDWPWEQRRQLGQRLLQDLAQDILPEVERSDEGRTLLYSLELDGFAYRDGRLIPSEADVFDVQEQVGVLKSLYAVLGLGDKETTFHHLVLSEEHYIDELWDDSISNSRKFLENILREVAAAFSSRKKQASLPEATYRKPIEVRNYLQKVGLLNTQEKDALATIYGLLSSAGGHPYMAESDQARLLRALALTFSQFVMLRLEGALRQP